MLQMKEEQMHRVVRKLVALSLVVAFVGALSSVAIADPAGFEYQGGQPYVMPGHFGAANTGWDGKVAHYEDNTAITIMYVTDREAVAALLPPGFTPTDPCVVSVAFVMCRGVDYMAGGGYNLVNVNVSARFEGKRDKAEGNFALVLWENDFFPIMLGREVLGAPKLYAEIPDAWMRDGKRGFTASENGTLLLEGEIWDLREATPEEMQAMAEQNKGKIWMGWKYIPSCDLRGADVSNATALPAKSDIKNVWMGQGKVTFHEVAWEKAPLSSRVVNVLNKLPVVQYQGALMTRGSQDLLIHLQHPME
ncbi:MAG: hypothetical protein C4532_00625 [Candidatus Abyssobacteria bacterium SURF_17]|uniref:Acetoacetate decarboxylase n=1 Tax=Candidatus Abyssobacteria bacterium SURF_17 TaxID=2093361 RepID=A0A419F9H0_9BACT|nr:MAG: hypothetical protein C4532_00625 [Candidatus Abyssubacteria bacterium SURF_17]